MDLISYSVRSSFGSTCILFLFPISQEICPAISPDSHAMECSLTKLNIVLKHTCTQYYDERVQRKSVLQPAIWASCI